MNNLFICKICGKEINSKSSGFHIKIKHNLSYKEYYDIYLKQEQDGKCLECGSPTKFINSHYRNFCSIKCSNKSKITQFKKEQTCLKRYGVEHVSQNKEIRQKQKETCLEKYGVESPFQVEEFKEKTKQTCLKKYGVEYPTQSQYILQKQKETCLKKFGVEHALQNNDCILKYKNTCLERYGVENPSYLNTIVEKRKNTYFNRTGYSNPSNNPDVISNKNKKYIINNIKFDSLPEAYYYFYNTLYLNNNIDYQVFYYKKYQSLNKEHNFIVDFKLDNLYIEIKGDHFFDQNDNPVFIFKNSKNPDNARKYETIWLDKYRFIKQQNDIIIIKSSEFNKSGKYYYMTTWFNEQNFSIIH